ncbi:hypothetical protein [Mycobacteroides franklinii]|uniref:FG-GAP repeat protein n=1 Tax=Mycobacteroides franklinii TaxID=948102 RepID=A0A4R5PF32_9MYCO|nr:hypothetical protein [Mycobacteroides franklinii]TDH24317.1 hypothetical protein EJ571_04110 [Mycobacteroides franklinii]
MRRAALVVGAFTLLGTGLAPSPAYADVLPECSDKFTNLSGPDCQLTSTDSQGLRFEKRIMDTAAQIRVLDRDGMLVQTLDDHLDGSVDSGVMLLRDLDGDGRDEVLLSLDTGSAHPNSHWVLWRATEDSTQLAVVPAPHLDDDTMHSPGAFFGVDFWHAGDGFIAEYGVGPMRSWLTRIYRFTGEELVPVVSVQNDGVKTDGSVPPCHLEKDYGLDRFGLSPEAARDRFCANTEQHRDGGR